MVDKFQKLFKINNKDSNVFIHNKSFDEVVDEISSLPNKIILMNSCFHHLIWVKEFLDLIKSSMRPGDSFVVCHEPDNSYANSLLMYINYFIRFIFTDFLLRRLRLKKSKKTIDDKERWQNINNDLVESGVLNQSVKPLIIRRIIDYGANNKGDWKYLTVPASYNEGYWLPSDIAEYFEEDCTLSYFNTYRHLGDAGNNKILRFLNRLLSSLFRKGGSAFCMVLKRSE